MKRKMMDNKNSIPVDDSYAGYESTGIFLLEV